MIKKDGGTWYINELEFLGNSLLVSPHGRVLAEGTGEDGLILADFDLQEARDLRRAVPVRQDQRPKVYGD